MKIYGHMLWDDFALKFKSQTKIKELLLMFPNSNAPRDYLYRKEIIEAGVLMSMFNWVFNKPNIEQVKTMYIRFEELHDWTPEQIEYAKANGIVMDGNSQKHQYWIDEYKPAWKGDWDDDI